LENYLHYAPVERLRIDRDICYGAAECVKAAPQAFALDDDGFVVALDLDVLDEEAMREAARRCPSGALSLDSGDA
jgi:ferredoxin